MDKQEALRDMITASLEQKPTNFSDSFNNIFMDKLHNAINNKKISYAKSMYGSSEVKDVDLENTTEE